MFVCYGKTVIVVAVKLSEQMGNGLAIMPVNLPCGSTLQHYLV